MTKHVLAIGCMMLLSTACSQQNPFSPTLAVPNSSSTPPPTPAPPRLGFAEPFTELTVGSTLHRRVGSAAENPECVDFPGWGCHYFRITPTRDGLIETHLTWVLATQPNQVLDMSITDANGLSSWANLDLNAGPLSVATLDAKAGHTYQVTIWYTFPGVEFDLQALLQSR